MPREVVEEDFSSLKGKVIKAFKKFQFGNKKQLEFLEDMYLLINDGIPANRAIEMMGEIATGINKEVAVTLSNKISEGQPLADGMKDWFSMNVVEIIRVGESGGALAQTLKSAINMLSQQGAALGAFFAAIGYPLFVIMMSCGVILYINASVFPQFLAIKPVDLWPDAGRRLVFVADLIKHWWWMSIVLVVVIVVVMRKILSDYVGPLRTQLDRFPPFSFYKRLVAARVLETLGLLVANGVVFKSALGVMQHQANPYLLSHLQQMEHLLSMGKTNIGDVLSTGLVNENDLMRLRVMAEVKGFEHGLIRMGIKGTEDATATMKAVSKVIGGMLLVVGGMMIVMIINGIYLTGMAMGS